VRNRLTSLGVKSHNVSYSFARANRKLVLDGKGCQDHNETCRAVFRRFTEPVLSPQNPLTFYSYVLTDGNRRLRVTTTRISPASISIIVKNPAILSLQLFDQPKWTVTFWRGSSTKTSFRQGKIASSSTKMQHGERNAVIESLVTHPLLTTCWLIYFYHFNKNRLRPSRWSREVGQNGH
jgi:hypothetical protein